MTTEAHGGEEQDDQPTGGHAPSPEAQALWMSMARLVSHLSREANRAVETAHGLTLSQMTALGLIRRTGGAARMVELSGGLQLTKPAITKIVDGLEASGWVTRVPDTQDRRATQVQMTDEGRALLGRAEATFEGVMHRGLWSHLGEEEIAAAGAALRKAESALGLRQGAVLPP